MARDPVAQAIADRVIYDAYARVQTPWMITTRDQQEFKKDAQQLRDDPELRASYLKYVATMQRM